MYPSINKLNLNNMTKQEAINRVNEGVGSIYTKEDVTNLINQIEETKVETTDEPQGLRGDIIRFISNNWVDVAEIFGELQMELTSNTIVQMDECEFTLEHGNKIELSDISFDEYEIESKLDNCKEALKEWVGATIVEACTIVEELGECEDTSIDEQVAQGEEQQAEQ